jgi:hypothetical protein
MMASIINSRFDGKMIRLHCLTNAPTSVDQSKRPLDRHMLAFDDDQVGLSGLIGVAAVLFPIAQRAERNLNPSLRRMRLADDTGLFRAVCSVVIGGFSGSASAAGRSLRPSSSGRVRHQPSNSLRSCGVALRAEIMRVRPLRSVEMTTNNVVPLKSTIAHDTANQYFASSGVTSGCGRWHLECGAGRAGSRSPWSARRRRSGRGRWPRGWRGRRCGRSGRPRSG